MEGCTKLFGTKDQLKESLLSDKGARYYEMKKGKKARSQQSFEVLKAVQKISARDMVDPVSRVANVLLKLQLY